MKYQHILFENVKTEEEIAEIKKTFEFTIKSVTPNIEEILYVTEDDMTSLNGKIRVHFTEQLLEQGLVKLEDTKYPTDLEPVPELMTQEMIDKIKESPEYSNEDSPEVVTQEMIDVIKERNRIKRKPYDDFSEKLSTIMKYSRDTLLLVVESLKTQLKWFSVISNNAYHMTNITYTDTDLIKVFVNMSRRLKVYDTTLHIPNDETEDKLSAIDVHYYAATETIGMTNCRMGAPIIEVYVSNPMKDKDGNDARGYHVIQVSYGDAGSMYDDIIMQLADIAEYDRIEIAIIRSKDTSPEVIEVKSLLDLKTRVFAMQADMRWYGLIESTDI